MTNISANYQNNNQFRFLKFPHSLLSDKRYAGITNDAKPLYALMLDRTSLSVKHSWYDREGRLFIYYTVKEIEGTLQCSHNKVLRMLDELENVQLIQRAKQGQGKPTKFYNQKDPVMKLLEVPKSNIRIPILKPPDFPKSKVKSSPNGKQPILKEIY